MAYIALPQSDNVKELEKLQEEFALDILNRLEFKILKREYKPSTDKFLKQFYDDEIDNNHLVLQSHQLFGRNLINYHSLLNRLLLMYGPGTGKTISAFAIALQFAQIFSKRYEDVGISPSIFIVGFTSVNIIKELLAYPELGFITRKERKYIKTLEKLAKTNPAYRQHLNEMELKLRHRIMRKDHGGFFVFYGYQELVNKLFNIEDESIVDIKVNFKQNIESGKITINKKLLEEMRNSILICDEIHNVYNTAETNNYGIALITILNYLKDEIRAIFLSATPHNNSPSETIDMLNLLIDKIEDKLHKKDFFRDRRVLLPGKLEELGRKSFGRILYMIDADLEYYPERIFEGEYLKLDRPINVSGKEISEFNFIKITPCKMSEFHYKSYESLDGHIPNDGRSILDIAFPNPDDNEPYGLFRSYNTVQQLKTAPKEWLAKNKIRIIVKNDLNVISGEFLHIDNIAYYSAKYFSMLKILENIMENELGSKVFIYHHWVKMSGVLLIQEILIMNGYIDEYSEAVANTRCSLCNKIQKDSIHKSDYIFPLNEIDKKVPHKFFPARFVIIHAEVKPEMAQLSKDQFNQPENTDGRYYRILIGSKKMKESHNLKAVRFILFMSFPINFSTYIQVMFRCIRRDSAALLPEGKRNLHIYTLISVSPKRYEISKEVRTIIEKAEDHKAIQEIEREYHKRAIDGWTHYSKIQGALKNRSEFDPLDYQPMYTLPKGTYLEDSREDVHEVDINNEAKEDKELSNVMKHTKDDTFIAYGYFQEEINEMISIIKRLFLKHPVWNIDDLWGVVRKSPFESGLDSRYFSKNNFYIAMEFLSSSDYKRLHESSSGSEDINVILDTLFDPNEKIILGFDGTRYKIVNVGYYVLAHLENGNPLIDINSFIDSVNIPSYVNVTIPKQFSKEDSVNRALISLGRLKEFKIFEGEYPLVYLFRDYDISFHTQILQCIIQDKLRNKELEEALIKMYRIFDIIITESKTPIGYNTPNTSVILTNAGDSKSNIGTSFSEKTRKYKNWEENNLIIGFFEDNKFKIRKPMQKLYKKTGDSRKIEKGMVCTTYPKKKLLKLAMELEVDISSKKVKNVCDGIMLQLLRLEAEERKERSSIKFVYMINDIIPNTRG
jgi:hypothetical protein